MAKIFVDRVHLVSIALVCALVIFAAVPAGAAGPLVLRAGASDPEGTTAPALSIGKLCELATKLSNGELNVQPFYQSLGIEQQLATAVKAGSVDIGFTATSNLAPFTDASSSSTSPSCSRTTGPISTFWRTIRPGRKRWPSSKRTWASRCW